MYIALILLGLFIVFVVMTDLGPQNSTKPFWKKLYEIRETADRAFGIIFIALVVMAVLIGVIVGIKNWMNGGGTSTLVTGAVFTLIVGFAFYCIRDARAAAKRGEACECCGDCSKCKIKCRTNEKYYGINQGKHKGNNNK